MARKVCAKQLFKQIETKVTSRTNYEVAGSSLAPFAAKAGAA